jgi:hypothetical protein
MTRENAAIVLGASVTQLDAALTQPASAASAGVTRGGLRADHAAAVFAAVTDPRRVSVIDAPAGSGKTTVLARTAKVWRDGGMGRVVGITPSQSARNTLAAGGVPESYNTAQFLGHLPGRPSARRPVPIGPGDLLLLDETSMDSIPDLADIISHAERNGAKVIAAGDSGQLQAVENAGGMTLLAGTLGYVRLAEPVRFAEEWERAASLRLRAGDISVLGEYDEHGRIVGGAPEEMMDAAARAYVALRLDGKDVLLMAADHARRRELSRRIRDDLIHLGLVSAGPSVRLADGSRVSAGDLIVCTENDHSVVAGKLGRTLANGDLLKVEAITPRGLVVRRAVEADPQSGRPRWTERSFLYGNFADCELGYAVTDHVAQSRTVDTGLELITGTEDRQHAYVGLTRGWRSNMAFVFTVSPKIADPAPGPRAAPEIARYDRLQALCAGQPGLDGSAIEMNTAAVEVLADVIARDRQERAATQLLQRNLAHADHLAILHAIWVGETTPVRDQRYCDLLVAALPAEYREDISHRARWLWRTLRSAELAGLNPAEVLREAVSQRSLSDARDVAAVVDARIRQRIGGSVPQGARPWSAQVPPMGDPERQEYVAQIARLMDERKERIGEHAAEHCLDWAVEALGPVPADPLDRLDWQLRASAIGAYRELYGYHHPSEPIGPEPVGDSPDKRAAWHEAFAALRLTADAQVRAMAEGMLLHLRDTYPVETAWAPAWVGDELRQVRRGAQEAKLAAIRAQAEAAAARRSRMGATADRHDALAVSYQAMAAAYEERERVFAGVMQDRRAWEQATNDKRRLAVAADAELRRRHPGRRFAPLRSAEPEPANETQRDALVLAVAENIPPLDPWIQKLAADRAVFAEQLAEWQNHEQARVGSDIEAVLGFAPLPGPGGEPLLQPPKPFILPSARVLERVNQRDGDMEAAT